MTRSLEPHGRVPAKLGRLSIAKYYGVSQVATYCYDFGDELVLGCLFFVAKFFLGNCIYVKAITLVLGSGSARGLGTLALSMR